MIAPRSIWLTWPGAHMLRSELGTFDQRQLQVPSGAVTAAASWALRFSGTRSFGMNESGRYPAWASSCSSRSWLPGGTR